MIFGKDVKNQEIKEFLTFERSLLKIKVITAILNILKSYRSVLLFDGRFGKKENDSIQLDSIHCSVRNPLDSPRQGFWTLVLKLLDQSTEAMTGRPALQQSC